MNLSKLINPKLCFTLLTSAVLVISGCGSDSDSGDDGAGGTNFPLGSTRAIVSGIANDRISSAAVEIYNASKPFDGVSGLNPGSADTIVRAFGDRYYVIRRFMSDSLTAYATEDPSSDLFQVSTNEEGLDESSNPYDLVFVNSEKAYLLRYGSGKLWIVNPSATEASEFYTGEIDLSAYDDDGIPEMALGVVANGKLFVFMQRLDGFEPTQPGVVAVIDTATDTEIDTGTSNDFSGIELPSFNPWRVSYDQTSGNILLASYGDSGFFNDNPQFNGGVHALNTLTYETSLVFDDTAESGRTTGILAVDSSTAFMISESGFNESSVAKINPTTGEVVQSDFAGITGVDVRALAIGPAGNLWVGIADAANPRLLIVDTDDGNQFGSEVRTVLDPNEIIFAQ